MPADHARARRPPRPHRRAAHRTGRRDAGHQALPCAGHEILERRRRRELERLRAAVEQKGLTLVPLRLHLKQGLAKLDIGVARGKKLYDKRTADADRQARRDVERALRGRE